MTGEIQPCVTTQAMQDRVTQTPQISKLVLNYTALTQELISTTHFLRIPGHICWNGSLHFAKKGKLILVSANSVLKVLIYPYRMEFQEVIKYFKLIY